MKNSKYYPTPASGISGLIISLSFGLFIGFFLWFFEPFDIELADYSDVQILFFGVITFVVLLLAHCIIPLFYSKIYNEKKWTIYSQILFYVIILLAIATFNRFYIDYLNGSILSWKSYLLILGRTTALGIIPIVIYVLWGYNVKYKNMSFQAEQLNDKLSNNPQHNNPKIYHVKTELQNEKIAMDNSSFLYAKSCNNYIEVHIANEKARLYRIKLTDFQNQLVDVKEIVRCHRSYVVNVDQISKITGNAQGLKLTIKGKGDIVPVSRKYIHTFRQRI